MTRNRLVAFLVAAFFGLFILTVAGCDAFNVFVEGNNISKEGQSSSSDGGLSFRQWENVGRGLENYDVRALLRTNGNFYCGTHTSGVWVLSNGEGDWKKLGNVLNSVVYELVYDEGNFYCGTYTSGVWVLSNGIGNWMQIGMNSYTVKCLLAYNEKIYCGTADYGVSVLAKGSTAWEIVGTALTNISVDELIEQNGNIYAGTGSGVWVLSNGSGDWVSLGLSSLNVEALTEYDGHIYSGAGKAYISSNASGVWTLLGTSMNNEILKMIRSGSNIYCGLYNGGVWILSNGNGAWKKYGTDSNFNVSISSLVMFEGKIYCGTCRNGVMRY